MHLLCQSLTAFVKQRLRDGVLGQKQLQRLNLTAVQFFVRELSCGRGVVSNIIFHAFKGGGT